MSKYKLYSTNIFTDFMSEIEIGDRKTSKIIFIIK